MTTPTRVVAIDPGLLSGIAVFDFNDNDLSLAYSDELHWPELGQYCDDVFREGGKSIAVAIERFTITVQTAKKSQAPWSLQCIGMVQWLAYQHGISDFALQDVAAAKSMFPNPRLQTLGFWHKGGEGHARDAIRHGLLYGISHGWRSEKLLESS